MKHTDQCASNKFNVCDCKPTTPTPTAHIHEYKMSPDDISPICDCGAVVPPSLNAECEEPKTMITTKTSNPPAIPPFDALASYAADTPETMLQAVIESISRKAETYAKEKRVNDSMDCEVWSRHLAWVRDAARQDANEWKLAYYAVSKLNTDLCQQRDKERDELKAELALTRKVADELAEELAAELESFAGITSRALDAHNNLKKGTEQ